MTDNPDRTFKPSIRQGQVFAGGMRIFQVDDEARVIFEDPHRRRCREKGRDADIPVDLVELLDAILGHYREK